MAKHGIEINAQGMRDILRSEGVRKDLDARARRVAAAAGPGMEASSTIGRRRAMAMVRTATPRARNGEAKDRRLTRAIDAGRG